jgi:hypothetical protein
VQRGLAVALACSALAICAGCGSPVKGAPADGGPGQGGAGGVTGAAGATGAAGTTGVAGTTGAGGATGAAGSGGGSVDAGSSHALCHTNADCTPPEVCYIGLNSALICSFSGQCVRFDAPCTNGDKCACLDIPSGSCTSVPGSFGCQGQDGGAGCWVCNVPA